MTGPLRSGELERELQEAAARVRHEAPRKLIHLTAIVIPVAILCLPLTVCRRGLMLAAAVFLVTDLVRIHNPKLRSYFAAFFGHLIRRHERTGLLGSTYMVISALLATYLFSREIAAAALVFLVVGDTLAAVVGKAWGRLPLFGKTLEGFFAGFAASLLAAWVLIPSLPLVHLTLAAFVAALVEVWPLPVDDNFRIPLVSGLVLEWLGRWGLLAG
jgi:dolichol kinase